MIDRGASNHVHDSRNHVHVISFAADRLGLGAIIGEQRERILHPEDFAAGVAVLEAPSAIDTHLLKLEGLAHAPRPGNLCRASYDRMVDT